MKKHAKAVVIGGGVVGCSVLYHLTKFGWKDVVLIERSLLTSGSTWHAAGGFHTLNADTNMAALQGYTIGLYKELEELSDQSCGLHHVGGITLACDQNRFDLLKTEHAKHRYMGLHTEIIGPEEIKKRSEITNIEGVIGGLWDPLDGHLDPSGTTHAYAKAAQRNGAEIVQNNPVIETRPTASGGWEIVTQDGTIVAEHLVNAAGLWAREVGALAGVYLPLHPMAHQYLVTDDIPEFSDMDQEHPHVIDPNSESYLRQEGKGLCIGFYEQDCRLWAVDGTPADFGHELLNEDLARIGGSLDLAWKRFPILETAGIKRVINGPFTFAPDGNPLVGPVPGLRNYWSACAVMAGFSQAGGVGLSLAEWMVEGEPSRDIFALDVARFGNFITPGYTRAKAQEFYQRRFSVSYPNEELPAARPFRLSPAYARWQAERAVFGQQYGLEVVNYFAPEGEPLYENPSFRRSNAFTAVGNEVRNVRNHVGFTEVTNFGKYHVYGPRAREWLDKIMAGRLPAPGQVTLSPMLSPKGRVIGDFTITALADDSFQLTASYASQAFHLRWFHAHQSAYKSNEVEIVNISNNWIGFQIAGPHARDLLAKLVEGDVSNQALPFMHARFFDMGPIRLFVQRLTYTGDLGYEIYADVESQLVLFDRLKELGAEFNLKPFGMRAIMSLRLDKFFGSWLREFKPDYQPAECGLDRFVSYRKNVDFIGKEAALREKETGPSRKIMAFEVDANGADVHGWEPLWIDGEVSGFVTSGGYSHYAEKSVALSFMPTSLIGQTGLSYEFEILGEKRKATPLLTPLFDADNTRMRG